MAAIRGACRGVLEIAQDNRLLKAVVSATHGADTELLPLLTTHSEPLLDTAKAVVRARVAAYDVPLPDSRLDAAIDLIVRVVLSHVMQPSRQPRRPPPTTSPGSPRTCCRRGSPCSGSRPRSRPTPDYADDAQRHHDGGVVAPLGGEGLVALDGGADDAGEDELEVAGDG